MATIIEDFIAQQPNLLKACQKILRQAIKPRTWYRWETIIGVAYAQGQKVRLRQYTDEQTQLFLCLAWLRRHYPRRKVTYRSLRDYWQSNEYKIESVFEQYCKSVNNESGFVVDEVQEQPKKLTLSEVKKRCDEIMNREVSRECWANWKQHIGIEKYTRTIDEGQGALLVFMACWRHDNPNKPFPSINRLLVMMNEKSRSGMTLETASSSRMWYQWRMRGCIGKDLPKYLASIGFKVALSTLYKWGNFSQCKHYSLSELAEWKKIAANKRLSA